MGFNVKTSSQGAYKAPHLFFRTQVVKAKGDGEITTRQAMVNSTREAALMIVNNQEKAKHDIQEAGLINRKEVIVSPVLALVHY